MRRINESDLPSFGNRFSMLLVICILVQVHFLSTFTLPIKYKSLRLMNSIEVALKILRTPGRSMQHRFAVIYIARPTKPNELRVVRVIKQTVKRYGE